MQKIRTSLKDIWNSFMITGADFTPLSDMPITPCISNTVPVKLISYVDAKTKYNKEIKSTPAFKEDAFIHFYLDDYKFDGHVSGVWSNPSSLLELSKHFSGIITPDFSTYADFPDPLKRYNTYRMRCFDYWFTLNHIPVIHNVRWGTPETWKYCFDGIPSKSIISIGTVASGLRNRLNDFIFCDGLFEAIKRINPSAIVIYGSAKHPAFDYAKAIGIQIVAFQSDTALAFERRRST